MAKKVPTEPEDPRWFKVETIGSLQPTLDAGTELLDIDTELVGRYKRAGYNVRITVDHSLIDAGKPAPITAHFRPREYYKTGVRAGTPKVKQV